MHARQGMPMVSRRVLAIVSLFIAVSVLAIFGAVRVLSPANVPFEESRVGVPKVAVLTSSYARTSGYQQRLISIFSYAGAIVSYIDFTDVLRGGLIIAQFDVLMVSDGISLWDLGYIPQNVTDAISQFASSGGGILWFGHGGTLDLAGHFIGLDPRVQEILGLSVKASSTRTPVVQLTEKGLSLASSPVSSSSWLMPSIVDISVRLLGADDVMIRTLANETVLAISHGPIRSGYSLYPIHERMPSQFLSDELWRNVLFTLSRLDPRHPVGIPGFFDPVTMRDAVAAFTIRRDDFLVPNDERILSMGFPVTILQWTRWFDGAPTIVQEYSRLLDLYDLEMAHHTWSHSSPQEMATRIQYEMEQPLVDLSSLFGLAPVVFGSPGGWAGFNESIVAGYSPPLLMHVGWGSGLYPVPIGPHVLGGVIPAVRDMNTRWSNATLSDWITGFSAGIRIHRLISTEWHPTTATNNITQIETFLNWVKQSQPNVLVTSLGRVAIQSYMRYSISSIRGTFRDNTYSLTISTSRSIYDLPLKIGESVRSGDLSDGRKVPFSDKFLVLPQIDNGTFKLTIETGKPAYPEIGGIGMKQPFLPVITDFAVDKSLMTIHLRADSEWVVSRPERVELKVDGAGLEVNAIEPQNASSCEIMSQDGLLATCWLGKGLILQINFSVRFASKAFLVPLQRVRFDIGIFTAVLMLSQSVSPHSFFKRPFLIRKSNLS